MLRQENCILTSFSLDDILRLQSVTRTVDILTSLNILKIFVQLDKSDTSMTFHLKNIIYGSFLFSVLHNILN